MMNEQEPREQRMDRPELREKIREYGRKLIVAYENAWALSQDGECLEMFTMDDFTDKVEALIFDEKEIRKPFNLADLSNPSEIRGKGTGV